MLDENYGYKPENGGFQDFGMIVDFNASSKEEVDELTKNPLIEALKN